MGWTSNESSPSCRRCSNGCTPNGSTNDARYDERSRSNSTTSCRSSSSKSCNGCSQPTKCTKSQLQVRSRCPQSSSSNGHGRSTTSSTTATTTCSTYSRTGTTYSIYAGCCTPTRTKADVG